MPIGSNQGNNNGNNGLDLDKISGLLEDLVEKMGVMVDVMEKRPRSDSPNSLYFGRSYYDSEQPRFVSGHEGTKFFEDMSSSEQRKTMSEYSAEFDETHKRMKEGLEKLNKLAFFTSELPDGTKLTDAQKEHYKQEYERLKQRHKQELELYAKEQNNINAQKNIEELKRKGYKDLEDYLDEKSFEGRTKERRKASNMIANSGLGNTFLGRGAQKILDTRQRIDSMGNFGKKLQNGYGDVLGKQLFGNGSAGKMAGGALKGFGSALTKLAGPIGWAMLAFDVASKAVKKFAEMVNVANAYISREMKAQTSLDKLAFDRETTLGELSNKMEVENIKYMGDLQLKEMEIQSENLKAAIDLSTRRFVDATEIAVGPLTKGINETAYDAARKNIDFQKDLLKTQNEIAARGETFELFKQRRGTEFGNVAAMNEQERKVAQAKYESDAFLTTAQKMIQQQYDLKGQLFSGNFTWGSKLANMENPTMFDDMTNVFNKEIVANGGITGAIINKSKSKALDAMGIEDTPLGLGLMSGMDLIRGTEGERRKEKEVTDMIQSSKSLPNGVNTETGHDIYKKNSQGFSWMDAMVTNRLFDIGKDLKNEAAVQYAQQMMFGPEWEKHMTEWNANTTNAVAGIMESAGKIQVETAKEVANAYLEKAAEIEKIWLELAQKTEQWLEEYEKLSNDLGISLGYTAEEGLREYQYRMLDVLENTVSKFGKDREDMVKMQQSYVESTGRQKLLNESDYGNLFGLGKYLGDDGLAAQYASEMEIFNHGASESVDLLDEALQSVNKIGLNGRKYTKDLVNNLRMAQKYNFKGGTKEFMEMAKWAQKTRFNMQSLGSIVDKIQEGGLEGVLQQSAQFQVLGGRAAMNSDPLGMLYDAWGDNASLMKRYQSMTEGFGTLNKKTGETTFDNITENMQIAAIAKAQGRSVEEVRDEITERNKRETVKSQLSLNQRRQFDKDQLDYLGSVAKYNKEKERFEVELKSGETVGVNEISAEQLKNAMPQGHEERMETYMQRLVTAAESVSGEEIAEKANIAAATLEDYINNYMERANAAHEQFAAAREQYIAETKAGMYTATQSFKDFIGVFNQGNSDISDAEAKINEMAGKIEEALGGVADVINQATTRIQQGVDGIPSGGNNSASNNSNFEFGGGTFREGAGGGGTWDGVMSGDGASMAVAASKVTPINDGSVTLTKTHPGDIGVFAKEGGPFDTLFNGIFGTIKSMSVAFDEARKTDSSMPYQRVFNDIADNVGKIKDSVKDKQNVNVNINGRLTLDCGNQSVDLVTIMKSDPMIVRKITEQVADQIYRNQNGGKTEGPGAGVRYSSMA